MRQSPDRWYHWVIGTVMVAALWAMILSVFIRTP